MSLPPSAEPDCQFRKGLGNECLHQVPPGLPVVLSHPLKDSWLNFSGKYQWSAFLMSKCPKQVWGIFFLLGTKGEQDAKHSPDSCASQALRGLVQQVRNGLSGDTFVGMCQLSPRSHSWSGNKLMRGKKSVVERHLLGFIDQAHLGWGSLQRLCLCVAVVQGLITQHSDNEAPASECPCCLPGISPGPQTAHPGPSGFSRGWRKVSFPIAGQDAEL